MRITNFRLKHRPDLIVLTIYTLLTLGLTYPVAFRLTSHIAGFAGEDNLQWRWFLWWFKHALLDLHTSVTHVSLLYAPTGGEQPLYAITTFIPALALPFTLLGGPTLGFNLSFLLSFALSAYSTYLLAYYLTRQRLAAFVAGLIFGFYPARFGYATGVFLGQLTTYFLPLYLLGLFMLTAPAHRAGAPRRLRRAIWTGIVLACLCLTWPLHVVYGVIAFTLPFLIFQTVKWLRPAPKWVEGLRPERVGGLRSDAKWVEGLRRPGLKYLILTFGLAFVLLIGPYLPLLSSFWRGDNKQLGDSETTTFAVDLLAFITPSNYHPILQPLHLLPAYTTHVLTDYNDIQERLAYIGVIPLLLVGLGLFKFRKRLMFWLLMALAAMTLSLGPLLKFNGGLVKLNIEGYVGYIVLPYALLRAIPILDWSGVLGRLSVITMLSVAIMAAYGLLGLESMLPRAGSGKAKYGLTAGLSLLILFEFLTIFPFPTEPDAVPAFYYRLKQGAESQPQQVIDLPLTGSPFYNNYAMHYQTVHQQPMAGGHFMRKPARAAEMTAFLQQLLSPPPVQTVVNLPNPEARLGLLNKFAFTQIIARLWLMQAEAAKAQLAYLAGWLHPAAVNGDSQVSVFEVQAGGSPLKITTLLDGEGWQPAKNLAQLQLQAPANLLVYVDDVQPQPALLQLSVSAASSDRYLAVDLDGRPAARFYLRSETLTYHLPLDLEPGIHQFTFWPDEACQKACVPVTFSHLSLEPSLPQEIQARLTPVTFGDQLTLVDSQLSTITPKPGEPLLIYLYWQGQSQSSANYSAFVHLLSPSGELIGQADYFLGGWLHPTSTWPAGHIAAVPSLFFIPPNAAPGSYQLRAGLYNAETGQRLTVTSASGPPDSTLLATITINP